MAVDLEKKGHVGVITMNRPEALNALNTPMLQELEKVIDQVEADDEIYVCVLTGAGRSFVAGADIGEMSAFGAVEGKKFGVVGTGAIGLRVAAIAQAFGCEVLAFSRTKKDVPGITCTDLDTLLSQCDIVSLHTPLNDSTRGLIGKEQLALMKKNAVLINTARGPVVDSQALAEALNEERIAGACIDVFETEPPVKKEHPLLNAKHVIATPHAAFATKEALVKRAVIVFDNITAWLNNSPQNVM